VAAVRYSVVVRNGKASLRARKPKTKSDPPSEHSIQVDTVNELSLRLRPEVLMFAVPNGALRHPNVAKKLKAEGVRPGWPDLGFAYEEGKTAWIEMKTDQGHLSTPQEGIRYRLEAMGHLYGVARTVEQALALCWRWRLLK